jgi:hypothetical protein
MLQFPQCHFLFPATLTPYPTLTWLGGQGQSKPVFPRRVPPVNFRLYLQGSSQVLAGYLLCLAETRAALTQARQTTQAAPLWTLGGDRFLSPLFLCEA